jgi:hypothetical protein
MVTQSRGTEMRRIRTLVSEEVAKSKHETDYQRQGRRPRFLMLISLPYGLERFK